ncbi:lipid-A-disaccharide synthase [Mesorhizobium sp. CAU 1741]|uniref:lipid-A-disaccharide synthase n=1 Tax=Mesorhizobium sp. CAU 1741 TaxID=3140366 RepID=UPI00325AC40B
MTAPLRVAIVAGEESGDLLGADLVAALKAATGRDVELVGVGGRHLASMGLNSLFDGSDIALMGVTAVIRDLPRLMRRIGQTADAVLRCNPDCLVTIDSPDFSLRVAKKVRAADPTIPIIHYVCPSVWAWRPGRAPAMREYVDRILCVLPFEPEALDRLHGPRGTYVGHRLATYPGVAAAAASQMARTHRPAGQPRKLLVLPGSRRGEVSRLLEPFGDVVRQLAGRGSSFEVTVPTVPHVAALLESGTANWPVRPAIVTDEAAKWRAFAEADAALAASGTVLLELALARVPTISCYRTDPLIGPLMRRLLTVWSAALPNLIADRPIVPEFYDIMLRPSYIVRVLEQLMADTAMRTAQLDGFRYVAERMATERPSGVLAAEAVLAEITTR